MEYTTEYALEEFKLHGEYQLLERLNRQLKIIFDVGCNIGEWSRMARSFNPIADIHMFDIGDKTFQKLLRNNVIDSRMFPNSFGLSSETKEIPLKYVLDNDRVTTTALKIFHNEYVIKTGIVVNPMTYVNNQGIDCIDFLKVDVEGHELEVLKGFQPMLEAGKIRCISFEYGLACIPNRIFLMDYYEYLAPMGYILGKLTPEGVIFRDYAYWQEDFNGPDFVAVHATQSNIIDIIKKGAD